MDRNYILDGKIAVREPDILKWGKWYETANRHVVSTVLDHIRISTVFLGVDHCWDGGTPILFETMVFGGEYDECQWRHSTWDEAERFHETVVQNLKNSVPLPQ